MSVWRSLVGGDGVVHATLLDPASSGREDIVGIARAADGAGSDVFLVGGSTDVTGRLVEEALGGIREVSDRPVLLFPSGAGQFVRGLDGLLFTVPFNSRRQGLIIEEQARGAGPVLEGGVETVNTAYVIVEPGMTVGRVADAELVSRDGEGARRVERYAALARVLRFDALYLEAGSGADRPVPVGLVEAAAGRGVSVIVGGGVRSGEAALALARAGADVVVTGTLAEDGELDALRALVGALKGFKAP